jgi:hypothetical protein
MDQVESEVCYYHSVQKVIDSKGTAEVKTEMTLSQAKMTFSGSSIGFIVRKS